MGRNEMGDQEWISNSSNRNGRQSKKPKQNKIPQRGLGVAQLEKIRLEEEVKNDAANLPPLAVTAHSSGIPFALQSRPYPFCNDNLYRHVPYSPHLNSRNHSIGTVFAPPPNNAGPENNLLSSTYIHEAKKFPRLNQSPNPPYEPMFMSHFGVAPHRNQQSSSFSSSVVNDAAENSSSAVLISQTEPPSNQSHYGTYQSVHPDETEKVIGMKRPCPLSIQDPSNTLRHSKFNSGSLVIKGNPSFRAREVIPHSISTSNLHHCNKAANRTSDGDFLNLAPPVIKSLFPSSKQEVSYLHTLQAETLEHNSTSYNVQNSDSHIQQRSFYMFLPEPNITKDGPSTVMTSHHRDETDVNVLDLNLKL